MTVANVTTAPVRATPVVTERVPRRRRRSQASLVLRTVVALVSTVIMAFPLWIMLVTAFSGRSSYSGVLDIWPKQLSMRNFERVFAVWPVGSWFVNSVIVTMIITIGTVTLGLLAGFAFAKLSFPLRTPLFLVIIATVMIPTQAILVSQFRLVNRLGLIGTFWAAIIPGIAVSTWAIFLSRQFLLAIPNELLEAARIDGATNVRLFTRIVLPLSRPLIAVLTLMSLLYQWNDFLWPLIVLREPVLYTLPIGLQFLSGQYLNDYGALMAMTLVQVTPLVILFVVFQRWFVQGLATTGLK